MEYIWKALQQGYMRPSSSPATSSFFFVAKKDGVLRPYIDYRALNKITVKFRYPLHFIPAALECLRGAKIFTKLYLIRIHEEDEWKMAFMTTTGHSECCIMLYVLVNAPSLFQDFMYKVLREYLLVYIDDILIYSWSLAKHRQHIAKVLQKLWEFNLFLKAEKCQFQQSEIQFLGYIVNQNDISMDERKVQAIHNWPTPKTVKEL